MFFNVSTAMFQTTFCTLLAQSVSLMSPENLVHIPRKFFEDNYDTAYIVENGITIQIQLNGVLDLEVSAPCLT